MTQTAPTASPSALAAMTDPLKRTYQAMTRERIAENEIDRLLRVEGNLRAEIGRLRATLREIAAYPHSENGGEIARRALEAKP